MDGFIYGSKGMIIDTFKKQYVHCTYIVYDCTTTTCFSGSEKLCDLHSKGWE